MPSEAAHLAAAKGNQRTIDYLMASNDNEHLSWVTSIAFYKALHVVEALFVADPRCSASHTDDHTQRLRVLKTTTRYQQIYKHYRPLFQASLIARYLRDNENAPTYDVFSDYLSRTDVESKVLGHWLTQIEKSVAGLLKRESLAG